jgi:DNA polymerase
VQLYREGRDVYSEFATKVYGRSITKADQVERFVGKTCTLGLGFGTGALKLQHTLKTSPPYVDQSETECQTLVRIYREVNFKVVELWKEADAALKDMADWPLSPNDTPIPNYYLGNHKCLLVTPIGIRLPNGLYIRYPELKWDTSEVKSKYTYKSRKGRISIWGGSVVENVIQALARIIVGEQMIKIGEKYRTALTVHDAAVIVAPKAEANEAMQYMMDVMNTPPVWGSSLPVACEAGMGESYGEC